jgi:hypothetical protein
LKTNRVSDRGFVIDASAIVAVSAGICLASDRLAVMTALVPAVIAARFAMWIQLPKEERGTVWGELAFFALCTAIGAFNDWNSVVRHEVYTYTAPHYFPDLSTIPLWMLLFWGMILRFLATLFQWRRLGPPPQPKNELHLAHHVVHRSWAKVAAQLMIVVVTRQLIYRWYGDPVLSWIPFIAALALFVLLFRPDRHDRLLIGVFAVGGPAVEALYIQLGELHQYELGWLAGVPLWIGLWWILAALIWKDLSNRLQLVLAR